MYTIEQIEKASAAIHNQATENTASEGRMTAIRRIHLEAIASGLTRVEKETLSEQEIALIDHFLK